jgi:hypothetical protein
MQKHIIISDLLNTCIQLSKKSCSLIKRAHMLQNYAVYNKAATVNASDKPDYVSAVT